MPAPARHAVLLGEDGFRVRHRGLDWGPFEYRFAADLRGVELWHVGEKTAEVCGPAQIHADLSGRGLPDRVVEVAALTFGVLVFAIREGRPDRGALLATELAARGLGRFAVEFTAD